MVSEITSQKHKITNIQDGRTDSFDVKSAYESMTQKNVDIGNKWLRIKKQSLSKLILKSYSDSDMKKILSVSAKKPATIPEILDISGIPNTAGYRKINWLIKVGLIIPRGYVTIQKKKKVRKYKSIFGNVRIIVNMNNISVKVKLNKIR